ncbi:MAG: siroheme decarboxylase subunit beta [Gammaproteobacteria bacterium]
MIDSKDLQLIETIQHGLPITQRPFAAIGEKFGMSESEVIERIGALKQLGLIKRMGVIVRHHSLGYKANAMVVIDVPDHLAGDIGGRIARFDFVTLCYLRPRRGEQWPFNLYCMIHGKTREKVLRQIEQLGEACGLSRFNREVLFSRRCFKQRGAVYRSALPAPERVFADG